MRTAPRQPVARTTRASAQPAAAHSAAGAKGREIAPPACGIDFVDRGMVAQRASGAPIQRKVGFEFEMTDISTERWGLWSGWHSHTKGAVLSKLPGYELTADVDALGASQLEVIIAPVDEASPAEVANLAGVTGPAVVQTIDDIAQAAHNAWMPANQIAGINGSSWDRYFSATNGVAGHIIGTLQMTGGIEMGKLHAHVSGAQATNYANTLNPGFNPSDAVMVNTLNDYYANPTSVAADAQVAADPVLGALVAGDQEQVAAVVALMAMIPINARGVVGLQYPKGAAGAHLARTDFSRIMMALPLAAKNVLTPAIMRTVVLNTINAMLPALPAAVVGADAVIPAGAPFPAAVPALNNLSIDAWVGRVVPTAGWITGHWQGRDLLTSRNFPGSRQQRSWLESMGSYGNRVDPGGRPLLEFRSLQQVDAVDLPGQLTRLADFVNH
jgi:hypothetical protein